jgi:CO/xanthine dehydrogenase Mo-binding subunit
VPRVEDERLLRGTGRFVADIAPPGTLSVAFVRSPHARARILHVDTSVASTATVVRVLTAADLSGVNKPLPVMAPSPDLVHPVTQRPIATEHVSYQGEIVAVVVAADRYQAEDAAGLVETRYEILPAVTDASAALAAHAPIVHPGCASNLIGSSHATVGDPARASADAHITVSLSLEIARSSALPLETRGVLADYDDTQDLLTVYSSTQIPHRIRSGLAEMLSRGEERIRVIAPDVGGAFGCKLCLYPEEVIVSFLALMLRRPVQWIEDRHEHFVATGHARGQVHNVQLAVRSDGTILALRDRFVHDGGAYAPYGIRLPLVTLTSLMGPYRIPAMDVSFDAVFTNKTPVIPYRGAGQPEAVFVIERALDHAARVLGLEPFEIRRRNMIPPEAFPYDTGLGYPGAGAVRYDSGNPSAVLDDVAARVDLPAFRAAQTRARGTGRFLGLGVACCMEGTGAGTFEGATVRVEGSGVVTVASGLCSQGQGHETIIAELCAAALGVSLDRVQVRLGDTQAIAYGGGTWGSRAAVFVGSAVTEAARRVRDRATRVAAKLLEADPADIRWGDGEAFVAGAPHRRVTLATLAQAAASARGPRLFPDSPGLEATHYFSPDAITYGQGAHAVIVEVDVETCQVRIVRYIVAHDCGRVLNETIVEGQLVGGIAQGVGGALYEELCFDREGQILNATLADYLLPTAGDLGPIEITRRVTPSALNPHGIKGVGEAGIIPAAAALASAIEDALSSWGIRITRVPVTPPWLRDLVTPLLRFDVLDRDGRGARRPAR